MSTNKDRVNILNIFLLSLCNEGIKFNSGKVAPQSSAPAASGVITVAPPSSISRARKNIIMTLLIVASFFIGCNLLKQLLLLVKFLGIAQVNTNSVIFNVSQILSIVNATIEPFIYLLHHREFQTGARKLFHLKVNGGLKDEEGSQINRVERPNR